MTLTTAYQIFGTPDHLDPSINPSIPKSLSSLEGCKIMFAAYGRVHGLFCLNSTIGSFSLLCDGNNVVLSKIEDFFINKIEDITSCLQSQGFNVSVNLNNNTYK